MQLVAVVKGDETSGSMVHVSVKNAHGYMDLLKTVGVHKEQRNRHRNKDSLFDLIRFNLVKLVNLIKFSLFFFLLSVLCFR